MDSLPDVDLHKRSGQSRWRELFAEREMQFARIKGLIQKGVLNEEQARGLDLRILNAIDGVIGTYLLTGEATIEQLQCWIKEEQFDDKITQLHKDKEIVDRAVINPEFALSIISVDEFRDHISDDELDRFVRGCIFSRANAMFFTVQHPLHPFNLDRQAGYEEELQEWLRLIADSQYYYYLGCRPKGEDYTKKDYQRAISASRWMYEKAIEAGDDAMRYTVSLPLAVDPEENIPGLDKIEKRREECLKQLEREDVFAATPSADDPYQRVIVEMMLHREIYRHLSPTVRFLMRERIYRTRPMEFLNHLLQMIFEVRHEIDSMSGNILHLSVEWIQHYNDQRKDCIKNALNKFYNDVYKPALDSEDADAALSLLEIPELSCFLDDPRCEVVGASKSTRIELGIRHEKVALVLLGALITESNRVMLGMKHEEVARALIKNLGLLTESNRVMLGVKYEEVAQALIKNSGLLTESNRVMLGMKHEEVALALIKNSDLLTVPNRVMLGMKHEEVALALIKDLYLCRSGPGWEDRRVVELNDFYNMAMGSDKVAVALCADQKLFCHFSQKKKDMLARRHLGVVEHLLESRRMNELQDLDLSTIMIAHLENNSLRWCDDQNAEGNRINKVVDNIKEDQSLLSQLNKECKRLMYFPTVSFIADSKPGTVGFFRLVRKKLSLPKLSETEFGLSPKQNKETDAMFAL